VWTGWQLVHRSAQGLMDVALPAEEHARVLAVLARYHALGIEHHALRTREAGSHRFVEMHVLVPGEWTIQRGHDLAEKLESEIRDALPQCTVLTHLEPLDDPISHEDIALDR
jgi:divalent metal cation (Fe/Co/Zn/Cd) transporter